MSDDTCGGCRHYRPAGFIRVARTNAAGDLVGIDEQPIGDCRARAPTRDRGHLSLLTSAVWPTVEASEWCGEFVSRSGGAL